MTWRACSSCLAQVLPGQGTLLREPLTLWSTLALLAGQPSCHAGFHTAQRANTGTRQTERQQRRAWEALGADSTRSRVWANDQILALGRTRRRWQIEC